jgi:hypothetical protein
VLSFLGLLLLVACLLDLLRLYFLFAVGKSQEMLQREAKLTIVMDDL